jgi:hypothetical protein
MAVIPFVNLYNYDMKQVTCFVNGALMTNWADGDAVAFDMNEDAYKLKIGATGEGTRSKTNNQSGRWTLNLMQSSPANDVLSAFFLTDQQVITGACIPIALVDLLGTTRITTPACWCVKWPGQKNAMEAQGRQWIFEFASALVFQGGNFPPLII